MSSTAEMMFKRVLFFTALVGFLKYHYVTIVDLVMGVEVKPENGIYFLNERNFYEHIGYGDHFVKFFAPWCGHCRRLAPDWEKLAKSMESDNSVKIGKFDCSEEQSICKTFNVQGYPTLIHFRNGELVQNYHGNRDFDSLKKFVKKIKKSNDKSKKKSSSKKNKGKEEF